MNSSANMTGLGIRIEGLRKRYGQGDTAVDALRNVNMIVAPGGRIKGAPEGLRRLRLWVQNHTETWKRPGPIDPSQCPRRPQNAFVQASYFQKGGLRWGLIQ